MRMGAALLLGETGEEGVGGCGDGIHARGKGVGERAVVMGGWWMNAGAVTGGDASAVVDTSRNEGGRE